MGKPGVVLFTVFTYIFMTSKNSLIECTNEETNLEGSHHSSSKNDNDDGDDSGLRSARINAYPNGSKQVYFEIIDTDHNNNEHRFKSQPLACETDYDFGIWEDVPSAYRKKIQTFPNNNVTLEVRDKTTNEIRGRHSTVSHAKEPEVKVTQLECNQRKCTATIEDRCTKYNGNNMSVEFTVSPLNYKNKSAVNSKRKAKIEFESLDLRPFTNYTVTASPANNAGVATNSSLTSEASFITKSENPGKVSSLAVTYSTPYSLHVEWSPPDDNPPKGKLENYRLKWNRNGVSTGKRTLYVMDNVKNFTITGLAPNTAYQIEVSAKNQDTSRYGEAVTVLNSTTEDTSDPKTGTGMSDAKTTLNFSWEDLQQIYKQHNYYNIKLSSGDKIIVENIIDTEFKFDGLTPGKNYMLNVTKCSTTENKCEILGMFTEWTKPEEPRVIENEELQTTTDKTITIQLPTLQNPPGKHWIFLEKYNGGSDDENNRQNALKAEEMAREKSEEEKKEKKSNRRKRRSANNVPLTIVAEIDVEEGKEQNETVMVGGDWNGGEGLEGDTEYVVFIVTETRAGPYSEFKVLEPRIMKTAPRHKEPAILGMIAGMCGAAVFLTCLFTMLVVKCRSPRKQLLDNHFCNPINKEDKPTVNPITQGDAVIDMPWNDTPKTIQPMETKWKPDHNKNTIEEDLYANGKQEVSKEDLEKYLPRAIHSSETTLEFNSVPFYMPGKTANGSRIPENVPKNRYKNDISYDDTRVKLPLYCDVPHSDYINANYVQDPSGSAAFIATQGPKDNNADTIGAFWRMIWHTKCRFILMVANLVEGGKVKVAQYWPEEKPLVKEGVKVTLTSVQALMDYVVRTFTVAVDGEERKVKQYHYIAWPDHGVPQTSYGLGYMLKAVIRDYAVDSQGPITVHCSAGIGRTGTIILTMFLLRQIRAFNAINAKRALQTLREGRGRLVENTEQYIFVHKLLYDVLFGMRTTYSCQSFVKEAAALLTSKDSEGKLVLEKEFEKMKKLPKDLTYKHGSNQACVHLNRNQDILPADKRMMFMQRYGTKADSSYVNIIKVNGFDRKDAYLAGEHPQPNTLAKIWHLVYEHGVSVWLLLQELPPNDPSFPDVVRETSAVPRNMSLEISQPTHFENFTEYTATLNKKETECWRSHKCTLLMLKGWSHSAKLPSSPLPLLGVIEKAESLLLLQTPLLFTCSDGVTACGVMATLLQAVCRAKLTQEVDLYRSAVSVQYDRPEFITDLMQYKFLFTAMKAFLNKNKHYGNFT